MLMVHAIKAHKPRMQRGYTKHAMVDQSNQKQNFNMLKQAQKLHKAKPKSC